MTAAVTASAIVQAASHIEEVFDCSLREDKTMKELNAINARWVKLMNKEVKGGGINSRVVTPVVGDFGQFFFVDSFPNLQSWADAKAVSDTKKGSAIEAEIEAVTDCTSNRLYSSTE
jgi:hypothetical protein